MTIPGTTLVNLPDTPPQNSDSLAQMLTDARRRTLALLEDILPVRELGPQMAIVNPPLWELGHVGFFHDYFALRRLYGLPDYQLKDAPVWFDSSSIAHEDRWKLALPSREETLSYLARVEQAMLARLPDGGTASREQSYVYQLTGLHEDMHGEAFTYTRQTLGDPPPQLGQTPDSRHGRTGPLPGDVPIPGGRHLLGSDETLPFRFDNEKPPINVEVAPFTIARAPVTNHEYAEFVDDRGYQRPEFWSRTGWRWRERAEAEAPCYWRRSAEGRWQERVFNRWQPLAPHQPVMHVNLYEALAWCNWAGRRLPTEEEWEVAASRTPDAGGKALGEDKHRYPWSEAPPTTDHANLDATTGGRLDVAALPEGDSLFGCRQMLGNVWEWTASQFGPFPGFQADLYQDYSQPWFPEGRHVLRGGAWATRNRLIHNTYRNFFTPERRDIFAGFRTCAL